MLNPIIVSLGCTLLKIVCLLIAIAYFTIAERKIRAAIQRRRGPNVVGVYGLLQPLADGLKLLAKERIIPSHANSRIFVRAPLVVLTLGLRAWSVIPFGCHDHSEYLSNSERVQACGGFWLLFISKAKKFIAEKKAFIAFGSRIVIALFCLACYVDPTIREERKKVIRWLIDFFNPWDLIDLRDLRDPIKPINPYPWVKNREFLILAFLVLNFIFLELIMSGKWWELARLILLWLLIFLFPVTCVPFAASTFGAWLQSALVFLCLFKVLLTLLQRIHKKVGAKELDAIEAKKHLRVLFLLFIALFVSMSEFERFLKKRANRLGIYRPWLRFKRKVIMWRRSWFFVGGFSDFNQLIEINSVGDVRYGLLLILALSSLTVYGLIISGWASNSKYAFLGALRSAAQRISYEVSISLIILPIMLLSGSLNFTEIVYAQQITVSNRRPLFPISGIYRVSRIAETNRTPFDLPEAEAELVAGYNVDYSSIIFARFFLAEYGNRIRMSTQKSLIFLGGAGVYELRHVFNSFVEALLLSFKTLIFCFVFVLVRATFPRYRYDQLRDIGWKTFLPVTTGFFLFVTGVIVLTGCAPIVYQLNAVEYAESFCLLRSRNKIRESKRTLRSTINAYIEANLTKSSTPNNPTVRTNLTLVQASILSAPEFATDLEKSAFDLVSFQRPDSNLEAYLTFSFFLYAIGLFGRILNRKNFIVTRRAVEVRYLGVITSFVIYGTVLNDPRGSIYGLLLVILAACESAIGLGIIVILHRFGGTINFQDYEELGG